MNNPVKTAECRSCDAAIVWMNTEAGRSIPVDADSVDESDLEWSVGINGTRPVFNPDEHVTHFSTCPNADIHRRKKRT